MDDIRQSNIARPEEVIRQNANKNPDEIIRQHPINASLRGQAKMAEMGEEVRRRQNRAGYNQYPPNTNYQQYQPPNTNNYYQQSQQNNQPQVNQAYQQQYYNQNQQFPQQQYQQPLSPSYLQSSNAYNHQTPTSTSNVRYPNTPNNQTPISQAQTAMQSLSLNTNYPNVTSPNFNQNSYNHSGPISPQGTSYKLPPTAPKPGRKVDEQLPDLPPSSTHPLFSASMQEPPKVAFYPNTTSQGKVGPANPWEREEREKVRIIKNIFL